MQKRIRYPSLTTAKQSGSFFYHSPAFQVILACIKYCLVGRLREIFGPLENKAVRALQVEVMTFLGYDDSAR